MRRRLILPKTGFPRQKFFTSYFIDGRLVFRIFTFYIVFDDLLLTGLSTRVWKHENQGPRFERNYIIAKEQIRDEYGASYQSSPKIHRMLIARLTMKVYPTRPVCLSIEVIVIKLNFFSTPEVFTCSKVINAFCINLSKALLTKHEWHCGKCLYVLSHVVIFIPSFHGLR